MGLVPYIELFEYAKEHKFTVGGFNSFNMESLQAIVAAANEKDTPLIVQTYHEHMEYAGVDYMNAICRVAAKNSKIKLALGLDHGKTFEQAVKCIDNGYSGVMIDLASDDYEYNVTETRKVVELAHSRGISVEAELGVISDADKTPEEIASGNTDPAIARKFVADTNVDCLAVSIGTAHGLYTYTPNINFDLLQELIDTIDCPIVVHGGSYTPDDDVRRMVKMGIAKLNVGGEFFAAYKEAMIHYIEEYGIGCEVIDVMAHARKAVEAVAIKKIDLLNTYKI